MEERDQAVSSQAVPSGVPAPPHPSLRRQPLPDQELKTAGEDAEARAQIERILASRSYRQADRDADFLSRADVRGVRLQMDYLKAELLLKEHGVENTVVVFGSTRIHEHGTSQRRVDDLRAAHADAPDDAELIRRLAVAERLLAKSHYYEVARQFGRLVAAGGDGPLDNRLALVTGGGPGMMEAANRGAFETGARSIGFNIMLPYEQYPNPYLTPDLPFRFHYFALRKLHFMLRARAVVAFPGGYGTFDEMFEALTLIQTRTIKPIPVVLVGRDYWQRAFDIDFLAAEGVIDEEDRDLFWYAESASEIWQGILAWHEANGTPLFSNRPSPP